MFMRAERSRGHDRLHITGNALLRTLRRPKENKHDRIAMSEVAPCQCVKPLCRGLLRLLATTWVSSLHRACLYRLRRPLRALANPTPRRVSMILRHPAWEFTDFLPLSFCPVEVVC